MFEGLFIKKANSGSVRRVLEAEGFIYSDEDIENLLKGNQKGVRYGNAVFERKENGVSIKRFFKIILDGKWRTYKLFQRQVGITAALHGDLKFTGPTMSVVRSSFKPPLPYAIFETRENGTGFGFMHDTSEYYETFTNQEMQQLVEVLYSFHRSGFNIHKDTLYYTRPISSRLNDYQREYKKLLDVRITHKLSDGSCVRKTVEELLIFYTQMPNVRQRIGEIFEKNWKYIHSSRAMSGLYLVHADMQIDNVYKHQNGDFELLDFEWVGRSDNPVIPIMYDYGNLRARAWSTPSFQAKLDTAMLKAGVQYYKNTELVSAALLLGVVRSSLTMSRFHLDFENTVKKDRRTEAEYYEMYPKTIAALTSALK
ncbi:MAG: hypothetical protein Q8R30_03410 [bacterium]|nr:hypothetical protein [bacterium]